MFQSFLMIISEFYLKLLSFKGFKGSVWVYNNCWPAHMKEGSGEHSWTHWHVQEHRSSSLCILNFEIAAQMFIYQLGSVCLLDNLFPSCKQTSTFRKEKKKNAIQNKIITFQYCFSCSDSVTCRKELEELHAYLTPPLFHKHLVSFLSDIICSKISEQVSVITSWNLLNREFHWISTCFLSL